MTTAKKKGTGTLLCLRNGHVLRHGKFVREDLWVCGGKILDPEKLFFKQQRMADVEIDVTDSYLAPGFIDIQLNGGFGVDFTSSSADNIADGIALVRRNVVRYGVTGFCPTLITSAPSVYHKLIPKVRRSRGGKRGAGVLGLHLEGPFISKKKRGVHPEQHVRKPEAGNSSLESVYGANLDEVKIVTLAPEHEYSSSCIRDLTKRGIRVSIGHTEATLEQAEHAVLLGATGITHLFNAMTAFHHRDPGVIGLLPYGPLKEYRFWYGIIADGHHTHEASMHLAYGTYPQGCVLITDSTQAMGLEPGEHHLGDQTLVLDDNHRLTLKGTDTLAGSAATMDLCVRRFSNISGRAQAIEAASLHPARFLGIDDCKGSLEYGFDADFVVLTPDMFVQATFIGGKCYFSNGDLPFEVFDLLE